MRVTALGIVPLCMLDTTKTLYCLKYTSFLGLAATVYIVLFMGARWAEGAYAVGGKFYSHVSPQLLPSFGGASGAGALSLGTLVLISMLATAFMAHYNAPAFMRDVSTRPAAIEWALLFRHHRSTRSHWTALTV